ncbi:unnamed protein product [Phytomonas sp. EM1]|nr:unnamed protein product [Phytomonas sp. EM1]|eukprot:CCW64192.1 unnamed protein product [Phytomonas sp. isolate EM1]
MASLPRITFLKRYKGELRLFELKHNSFYSREYSLREILDTHMTMCVSLFLRG